MILEWVMASMRWRYLLRLSAGRLGRQLFIIRSCYYLHSHVYHRTEAMQSYGKPSSLDG